MLKRDDDEHPIPEPLRPLFRQIADAFVANDFLLREHPIDDVDPIAPETAENIAANIASYGDRLVPLDEATWEHSIYRWMGDHWIMLVDLSTAGEPVSDLTLHARLPEGDGAKLEIFSVHVP